MTVRARFLQSLFALVMVASWSGTGIAAQQKDSEAWFPVCDGARQSHPWGYIDNDGKMIVKPRFSYAWDFSEGLAAVEVENEDKDGFTQCRLGYIDAHGNMAIRPQFGCLASRADFALGGNPDGFSDGLAIVYIGTKTGYIDHQGNLVISPQPNSQSIDDMVPFHGGATTLYLDSKRHFWSYINKSGKIIWTSKNRDEDPHSFSDGMNFVYQDHKCGYIDTDGRWVIPPKYAGCEDFKEGLAAVNFCRTNGSFVNFCKWGYLDKSGNFAVEPQFDSVSDFSDGLAWVHEKKDKTVSILDRKSLIITKTRIPSNWGVSGFSEGLAAFDVGQTYGFVNRLGKIVIRLKRPYTFLPGEQFKEGFATVFNGTNINKIDKQGRLLLKRDVDGAFFPFEHGLSLLSDHRGTGYINRTGKYVWDPSKSCH